MQEINPFEPPSEKDRRKYKILLHKRYFDTGYNLTNYIKYIIALFGISSLNIQLTLILGFIYAVFCYIIGHIWHKHRFVEVDNEISNRFNLFTREMREKVK